MSNNDVRSAVLRQQLHDINDALNSIAMQAEFIRLQHRGGEFPQGVEAALDVIIGECRNGGALTHSASSTLLGIGEQN